MNSKFALPLCSFEPKAVADSIYDDFPANQRSNKIMNSKIRFAAVLIGAEGDRKNICDNFPRISAARK